MKKQTTTTTATTMSVTTSLTTLSRREALGELAVVAGAAVCAGGIAGCASSGGGGGSGALQPQAAQRLGRVEVGSGAADIARGVTDHWSKTDGFLLVREEKHVYAFSSECTHKRCLLAAAGGAVRCPCHGSSFDMTGAVTKGPAEEPLRRVWIERDLSGRIIVDSSRRLGANVAPGEAGSAVEL